MKTAIMILAMMSACGVFAADVVENNKNLRKEKEELSAKKNDLKQQESNLKETAETLETTRDLTSGKLKKAPVKPSEKIVKYNFETNEPKVLDNMETKKRKVVQRWLKLEQGKTYLFEAMVKMEQSSKNVHIKFGGFVPIKGKKTQWPDCQVGKGTFDWRKCSFRYKLPHGASFCLIYGVETGFAKVLFKDVTVSEVE